MQGKSDRDRVSQSVSECIEARCEDGSRRTVYGFLFLRVDQDPLSRRRRSLVLKEHFA